MAACPAVFGDYHFGKLSAQPHTRCFPCALERTKIPHPSPCTFSPTARILFMHTFYAEPCGSAHTPITARQNNVSQASQSKHIPILERFFLVVSLQALLLTVEICRQIFHPPHHAGFGCPPRRGPYAAPRGQLPCFPKAQVTPNPITALRRHWNSGFVSGIIGVSDLELPVTVTRTSNCGNQNFQFR